MWSDFIFKAECSQTPPQIASIEDRRRSSYHDYTQHSHSGQLVKLGTPSSTLTRWQISERAILESRPKFGRSFASIWTELGGCVNVCMNDVVGFLQLSSLGTLLGLITSQIPYMNKCLRCSCAHVCSDVLTKRNSNGARAHEMAIQILSGNCTLEYYIVVATETPAMNLLKWLWVICLHSYCDHIIGCFLIDINKIRRVVWS